VADKFEFDSPDSVINNHHIKGKRLRGVSLDNVVREILEGYMNKSQIEDDEFWRALTIDKKRGRAFLERRGGLTLEDLSKIIAMAGYTVMEFFGLHSDFVTPENVTSMKEVLIRTKYSLFDEAQCKEELDLWNKARAYGIEEPVRKAMVAVVEGHERRNPEEREEIVDYYRAPNKRSAYQDLSED